MSTRRFQRRIETFTCAHCNANIEGNGFTNHCPHCLWSRHVDIRPGDRAESCLGMMRPISIKQEKGEYRVIHRCESCGVERVCTTAKEDSFEEILKVVSGASYAKSR